MVQFLERKKYYSKSALFSVEFELDSIKKKFAYFDPLFLILNKYYPGYYFQRKNEMGMLARYYWEDILLNDDRSIYYKWGTDEFELLSDIVVPLYKDSDKDVLLNYLDGGLSLFIKSDSNSNNSVIISFHSTLLLKKVNYWIDTERVFEDQTHSSELNRKNLKNMIIEIENYYKWDLINSWSDLEIDTEYIYKYGIKDNAVLNNGEGA